MSLTGGKYPGWTDLLTLTNLTGTVSFVDAVSHLSRRFYRLRLEP